ncbi:hypothetical protein HPB51_005894 [Rhipicephalus microplus]|uniref:Uncharacterized protein n=1 Tax=Rhipicephalus microplus TaxID=6941 RepID=A0A9J6D4R9_RHIMP|nr:hypothetical protein HPB51_005894 [Rhipicephalus microplus]
MAGWSSSSTRRRSFSSAVRIASPSPASSCSNRSFGLASPSPIRISGIASGRAHTKSPSATSAPVGSASSKTARLTVHSAGAQSPKPGDLTRQCQPSATRRPSCAASSSDRVVRRASPATRRRQSSAAGPVSQPPSLGSVPELSEAAGVQQFKELAPQATTAKSTAKSVNKAFPETRKARLLAPRMSVPSSTDPETAAPLSTTGAARVSPMKTLRFEKNVMPSSGAS